MGAAEDITENVGEMAAWVKKQSKGAEVRTDQP